MTASAQVDTRGRRARSTVELSWDLWRGLRDWPWDEKEIPRKREPHPAPAVSSTIGDWLTEFEISTWPPAPDGWRLTQHYAEGNGIHSSHGTPLGLVRSVALAYYHSATARGATAILHFKAGAKRDGSGSWRFAEGFRWQICTEIDCEHDRVHTVSPPQSAGAEEIKTLLTEGIT